MIVSGKPVNFQLDCGATVNILPVKYLNKQEMKPCENTLVMWNGTTVKPLGVSRLKVRNPKIGKNYSVEFIIVHENLTPLLGLRATEQMKLLSVHRENFKAVNAVRACSKEEILAKYPDVFNNKLGKLFR